MTDQHYINANQARWDETATIHQDWYFKQLLEQVATPGFSVLDAVESALFERIGLRGKSIIQLGCNNGQELISISKAGAARCCGVDFSAPFIGQARALAEAAGCAIDFICADIYSLPQRAPGQFDIVYVSVGVLGWMPDLDALFAVIAGLLRPGGQLLIYEMHPVLDMFEPETGLVVTQSYLRREPFALDEADYLDPSKKAAATSFWFHHPLGDIVTSCVTHGMMLTALKEYRHDISASYRDFEQAEHALPMCYTLLATRTGVTP